MCVCVCVASCALYVLLNFTPKVVVLSSIIAIKTAIGNTIVIISVRYILDDQVWVCVQIVAYDYTHV